MVFALTVPGRVQNVKDCTKLAKSPALCNNNCAIVLQRVPFFVDLCQYGSKGMDLGPNYVPVRAGFGKFCATNSQGSKLLIIR